MVVWKRYYINTLKQELSTAKTYEHNRLDETSIVDRHRCHMAAKFGLFVDEDHSKLPTLYWLPKLHKRPYKSRFIANSSACTTTELSILLTSCLTAIKSHVIKYCTTVYERNGKKLFWSIKNSGEILNKLKSRGFLASGLSTYDFSTLYTTLPHNLIKEKPAVIWRTYTAPINNIIWTINLHHIFAYNDSKCLLLTLFLKYI